MIEQIENCKDYAIGCAKIQKLRYVWYEKGKNHHISKVEKCPNLRTYVHMFVCMYVCLYACMYICMHG